MVNLPTPPGDDSGWNKWGKANKLRGRGYADLAMDFVAKFPIGKYIDNEEFDIWLQEQGMLTIPSEDLPSNSDQWMAHLQRRYQCKMRINTAATHPRMTNENSTPFIIVSIRKGVEVQSPQIAAASVGLPKKISSLIDTKRKHLSYLMQSADWAVLPLHEQAIAEAVYDDIDQFTITTKNNAEFISKKLDKLQRRIKQLMDAGAVIPQNGGIRQLLLETDEPVEDDDTTG